MNKLQRKMRQMVRRPAFWLALIAIAALIPRAVVTEGSVERKKWTEYFVYSIAAERLAHNEQIHVLPNTDETVLARPRMLERAQFNPDNISEESRERFLNKAENHVYSYPPLAALLTLPFTVFGSHNVGVVLWYLAIMLSMLGLCLIAWNTLLPVTRDGSPEDLVGNDASPLQRALKLQQPKLHAIASALVFVIVGGALFSPIANQQNDSMLLLMALVGIWLVKEKREIAAGVLFGIAGGMKGPLLIFLPWLMLRKRWMGSIMLVVSAVALNLAPDIFFGSPTGRLYVHDWFELAVRPSLESGGAAAVAEGIWGKDSTTNQALAATLTRLLTENAPGSPYTSLAELSQGTVKLIGYVAVMIVFAGSIIALWLRRDAGSDANDPVSARPEEPRLAGFMREGALFLMLALLFSPKTSPAHLCMTLPAVMIIVRDTWVTRDRLLIAIAAPALLTLAFVHKSLVGRELVESARFYGMACAQLLLITFALWRSLILIPTRRNLAESNRDNPLPAQSLRPRA